MAYKIYLIFKSKFPAEKGKQDKCKNDKNTKTRHSTKIGKINSYCLRTASRQKDRLSCLKPDLWRAPTLHILMGYLSIKVNKNI